MSALPGGVFPIPRYRAVDTTGAPINGAKLFFWQTGGTFSTLKSVYSSAALSVALSNPVVSDSAGLFAAMFFAVDGYDVQLKSNDLATTYWTALDIQDVGQTFLAQLGLQMAAGTFDVNSGYVVIDGDWFVTSDAGDTTNPFILQLPPLAGWVTPLTFKHQSANAAEVTPDGVDTIDGVAAPLDLAAAIGKRPTITLVPGASTWFRYSSDDL